jgi:hypothetical protein
VRLLTVLQTLAVQHGMTVVVRENVYLVTDPESDAVRPNDIDRLRVYKEAEDARSAATAKKP